MRNRGRTRRCGRRLAAAGGVVGPDAAHTILTVTDSGLGTGLVTTAAPHGLTAANVTISGTSGGLYDGPQSATAVDVNTFEIATAYVGDATGGTWSLA